MTKFLEHIESDPLVSSLKEVIRGKTKWFSKKLLTFALTHQYITRWEHDFYLKWKLKRKKLSDKVIVIMNSINQKIFYYISGTN